MVKPGDTIGYMWHGEVKSGTVVSVTGTDSGAKIEVV